MTRTSLTPTTTAYLYAPEEPNHVVIGLGLRPGLYPRLRLKAQALKPLKFEFVWA